MEYLEGVDDLPAIVTDFAPSPGRRLGVLVDHLVAGSKETRIAASVRSPHVLVVGHPYIDIWAAVKPAAVGIAAWPDVPRGQPWKEGVLDALGWRMESYAAWRRILGAVRGWTDLEPELLGRVEELIDFVTAAPDEGRDGGRGTGTRREGTRPPARAAHRARAPLGPRRACRGDPRESCSA